MIPEARFERTEHGLSARGEGWFVLNAQEAEWRDRGPRGLACHFEGDAWYQGLGIRLFVLEPGQPMSMYHREDDQEDFLVLSGEAVAVVEGEERPLRQWDFLHCPAGTPHTIVGAGNGRCTILAVGSRASGDAGLYYPRDETAARHGASADADTPSPEEAYARFPDPRTVAYGGWLPELDFPE